MRKFMRLILAANASQQIFIPISGTILKKIGLHHSHPPRNDAIHNLVTP